MGKSLADSVFKMTYLVFEVGQIDIPAQGDEVDVDDAIFGRDEVEVNHLSRWPHAAVCLEETKANELVAEVPD